MAKDVKFNIRLSIDGKEQVVTARAHVRELAKGLSSVRERARDAGDEMASFSHAVQAFQAVSQAVKDASSVLQEYTRAHALQVEAETKLATVMKQRMGASESDIQAMKDLASAQQELGVIGDEVQLAGMQQVATFLSQRASLEALVPAMNNLIAQQHGLAATQQDATSIGNLLGKAMQGQTSSLTRVGITFTSAQEAMMKYGTESERAATLAQVITDNVGRMNAELAKTDAGRAQQTANAIGDLKERVGAVIAPVQGVVEAFSQFAVASLGALTLVTSVTKLASSVGVAKVAIKLFASAATLSGVSSTRAAAAVRVLSTAMKTGAVSATALKIAMRGLLVSTGVGIAIAALSTAIEWFIGRSDEASDSASDLGGSMRELEEGQQAFASAAGEASQAMEKEISSLYSLIRSGTDASAAVSELNNRYGEIFGSHATASEWYDTLTEKSRQYCMQLGYEAQAKAIASKLAQKKVAAEMAKDRMADMDRRGEGKKSFVYEKDDVDLQNMEIRGKKKYRVTIYPKAYKEQLDLLRKNQGEAAKLEDELNTVNRLMSENGKGLRSANGKPIQTGQSASGTSSPSKNGTASAGKSDPYSPMNAVALKPLDESVKESYSELDSAASSLMERLRSFRVVGEPVDVASLISINDVDRELDWVEERLRSINQADEEGISTLSQYIKKLRERKSLMESQRGLGNTGDANAVREQKSEMDLLNESYRKTYKEATQYTDLMKGSIQQADNVVGGVRSITQALEGDSDAWEKTTAMVNGFFQVYEGMASIISLITALTSANTAATQADTAATTANTVAKGAEAVAGATSSGASMPFPLNIVAIAAGVAAVVAALATCFATGGIVGGTSTTGDRVLARVNSGEMILNRSQQIRLLSILNGTRLLSAQIPAMPSYTSSQMSPRYGSPVDVGVLIEQPSERMEFVQRGDDLVATCRRREKRMRRM